MTIEEKLKNYILERYGSLREFTISIDFPYSTMQSILKRGIQNANVLNIIKICKALNISTEALSKGEIVISESASKQQKLEDIIYNTKQKILNSDHLTIDGKPATEDDVSLIISMIDASLNVTMKNRKDPD